MNEAKFTKGPWERSEHERLTPYQIRGDGGSCAVAYTTIQGLATDANANLVAAAPEMYEALEKMAVISAKLLDGSERTQRLSDCIAASFGVLAKARGES